MSSISALYALRTYIQSYTGTSLADAIESLRRSDADMSAIDFAGAATLHAALDLPAADEPITFFRGTLTAWIDHTDPWWLRLFPHGRERVLAALSSDEVQCFRAAGLLQDTPDAETYRWWDHFAGIRRAIENDDRTEQGREAERWSMEYERNRLRDLGIRLSPRWTAIENNGAGFDIQSYDSGPVEPVARLIEVKSSSQSPPRIVVTRNEWETATQFGDRYFFHVWAVPSRALKVLSSSDVEPHIPRDRGAGRWSEVAVPIAS